MSSDRAATAGYGHRGATLSAERATAEGRDRAQIVLGAVSLVIWFIAAFALAINWWVDEYSARPILMAGGIAFLIAAIPWLAYAPLSRRLTHRSR
ncbi:MAG: hypothetical protein NVSMB2_05370 [Chloroflexota bacterium]